MDQIVGGFIGFVTLAGFSIVCFKFGRAIQTGEYRMWWPMSTRYSTPVMPFKFAAYASLPWSVAFFILGVAMLLPTVELRQIGLCWGFSPAFVIGILIVVVRPRWLVPEWLQYLEDNHEDILDLLEEEAGLTERWAERTATQEGLEAWVAEVRQKHGL